MAIPTAYTEEQLKTYMLADLGNLGSVLGLTAANFGEAVNDAMLAYDVTDIADATDIAKLRALARVQAWQVAVTASAGWYDFQAGDDRFNRAKVHDQAMAGLARAQSAALVYGVTIPGYEVGQTAFSFDANPYLAPTDE